MTEEVKPVEKKIRKAPKVISGDQHEVEAALSAHAEARVAEVTVAEVKVSVPTMHDVDANLPANVRAEREAGRNALAKNVKR